MQAVIIHPRIRPGEYSPDLSIVSTDTTEVFPKTIRSVLDKFPYSQHRTVVVDWERKIPIVHTIQKLRWNFNKANWENFSKELGLIIKWIPHEIEACDYFTNAIIAVAKKNIPRGFRRDNIPGWSEYCEEIYEELNWSGDPKLDR